MGMRRGDVTRRRGAVFYELSLTGGFRNCHWETIHAYVTKKRLIYEKSVIIRNVNVIHCLLENTITLNYLLGSGGFRGRHLLKLFVWKALPKYHYFDILILVHPLLFENLDPPLRLMAKIRKWKLWEAGGRNTGPRGAWVPLVLPICVFVNV